MQALRNVLASKPVIVSNCLKGSLIKSGVMRDRSGRGESQKYLCADIRAAGNPERSAMQFHQGPDDR